MEQSEIERFLSGFRAWLNDRHHTAPISEEKNIDSLLHEYLSSTGIRDVDEYIGNLKALRAGKTYQTLTDEMTRLGAKPKRSVRLDEDSDILVRHRKVPLHAMFLYTSEDKTVEAYIADNWGALDTLSGDFCDIHQSVDQFQNAADAYDFIEHLDVIRDSGSVAYSKLPGMFFWDNNGVVEYIPFGVTPTLEHIRLIVRTIFEEVRNNPTITSVKRAKKNLENAHYPTRTAPIKKPSIWGDLIGFLLAFVVVIGAVVLASRWASPLVLGVVLIATILIFLLVAALILRRSDDLSESNFMTVISHIVRSIPLLRQISESNNKNND